MKKVLLTSTALVAFAGAAAAEVTLSGWAEMGVVGGKDQATQFFQDVDVDFTLTGEADNGLTFGANVDLDEAGNLGDPFSNQGVDIFVSGEFGTVTLGDTDSAFSWAVGNIADWNDPGTIDDSETGHFGYQEDFLTGRYYDGQVLRYDYTYDAFGFAVSLEQDDRSDVELDGEDRDDYQWAVGATYSPELGAGTLSLGIGYEQAPKAAIGFNLTDNASAQLAADYEGLSDDDKEVLASVFGFDPSDDSSELDAITVNLGNDVSAWGLSAGYTADSGWALGAIYAQFDGNDLKDGYYWGIGAGYTYEAFTIYANYGEHSFEGNNDATLDADGWGLAMGYDMGGGLSVLAGYGSSTLDVDTGNAKADADFDTWSLGLSMAF